MRVAPEQLVHARRGVGLPAAEPARDGWECRRSARTCDVLGERFPDDASEADAAAFRESLQAPLELVIEKDGRPVHATYVSHAICCVKLGGIQPRSGLGPASDFDSQRAVTLAVSATELVTSRDERATHEKVLVSVLAALPEDPYMALCFYWLRTDCGSYTSWCPRSCARSPCRLANSASKCSSGESHTGIRVSIGSSWKLRKSDWVTSGQSSCCCGTPMILRTRTIGYEHSGPEGLNELCVIACAGLRRTCRRGGGRA